MRCKYCDARLAKHDLWCSNCGHQTQVVNKDLSSWASFKGTWHKCKEMKGQNVPASAFTILTSVIPLLVLLYVLKGFGILDINEVKDTGTLLLNLLIIYVIVTPFVGMFLLPFKAVSKAKEHLVKIRDIFGEFNHSPQYGLLAVISVLYFVVVYLICFGLPNFGSDPILRLVWLVLVNYFFAVFLPVPILMERKQVNAWKAFRISYKYFHVVRWQMYLLALVLAVLNTIALALFIVPLLITLPLSWFAIRDYTDLVLEYEIIREPK